jgi:methionyl-tRNA formyltransferase
MRVVFITQDDPFFLAENFDYLLSGKPEHFEAVGCVVFKATPFCKKESFLDKCRRTRAVFGAGFFLRYSMKYLLNKLDKGKDLLKVLEKHGVPVIDIEGGINSEQSLEKIRSYRPDLLVSVAGNQIFKENLINLAPKGCLNLHTALLPKYRGLMPTFWVLKNGEKFTGVSVFFVDEGIDSGPILVQKKLEIGDRTQEELIRDTKRMGMDAIIEAVDLIHSGDYELMENRDEDKSYYSFPTREDVREFQKAGKRFY